jgi:hypothetical protein
VARSAFSAKVGLAGFSITRNGAKKLISPAIRSQFDAHMKELCQIIEFSACKRRKRWHSFVHSSVVDDGANQLTLLVVQNERGTH